MGPKRAPPQGNTSDCLQSETGIRERGHCPLNGGFHVILWSSKAPGRSCPISTNAILFVYFLYLAFSERLVLTFATEGRGVFPLMSVLLVIVGASLLLSHRIRKHLSFMTAGRFWLCWGSYAALTTAYPLLGVVIMNYPDRTLMNSVEGMQSFALLAIGGYLSSRGPTAMHKVHIVWVGYMLVECIAALGQIINNHTTAGWAILEWQATWDQEWQTVFREGIFYGRSIGTHLNPNTLGCGAMLSCIYAISHFSGSGQVTAFVIALMTLLMSQSRGALFGLSGGIGVLLIVELFRLLFAGGKARGNLNRLSQPVWIVTVSLLVFLTLRMADLVPDRFVSGVSAITAGAREDESFFVRTLVWREALAFSMSYPLGTLGPPAFLFKSATDSDYVNRYLQGGPILLCLFVLVFAGWLVRPRRPVVIDNDRRFLFLASVSLLICSIGQTPTSYPTFSIFWMYTGACLSRRSLIHASAPSGQAKTAPV